jgi:hypothetical protein
MVSTTRNFEPPIQSNEPTPSFRKNSGAFVTKAFRAPAFVALPENV